MIYCLCGIVFIFWFLMFFVAKKKNSCLTYIFWGIYFPLFLYQLKWSELIDTTNSFYFNYIFICLTFICFLYFVITYKKLYVKGIEGKICITKFGKQIFYILNFGYLFLYLVENYLGSGTIIPGLKGIDIHTYSFPVISYITNAQFLILAYNYYYFKATKKTFCLLFIFLVILLPILTRLARMSVVISVVQLFSLILFMELHNNNSKKSNKKKKLYIYLIAIIGFIGMSMFTQYRMNLHAAENTYLSGIGYCGPKIFEWLAPYYGYFPMSFNNLKINIIYRTITHNYVGLYSFNSLYFGLLQLDNILGISPTGFLKNRIVLTGLATVPTGFYEFYYDYGILLFIPIFVAMFITYKFEKNGAKEKKYLAYRTMYYWYISYWFFMSFQNTLFLSTAIIDGFMTYFIIKYSFKIEENEKKEELYGKIIN